MPAPFDPYHKWLGIPPKDQPPDHYRLLGISPFEAELDVIDAAFYRQPATPPVTTGLAPPSPPEPPVATHEAPLTSDRPSRWRYPRRRGTWRRRTGKSAFIEMLKVTLGGIAGLVVAYCALLFVFQIDLLDRLSSPQAKKSQRPPMPTDPVAAVRDQPAPLRPGEIPPLAIAPFDAQQARHHQAAWADHLEVPVESENSVGMRFALIPPGEFLMGSPTSDRDAKSNERPQRRVRITKPFYFGVYEVTQVEYQQIMGDNPSRFKTDPRLPVERVSWEDAMEFCSRLSGLSPEKSASRIYRSPTEAEWEYACRAGTTSIYSFGDSVDLLSDNAWHSVNSGRKTHQVGQQKPNAWGLHDMHGNVWEWCADWLGEYAVAPLDDPTGLAAACSACSVAAAGAATRHSAGRRTGTSSHPAAGTTTSGSAWPAVRWISPAVSEFKSVKQSVERGRRIGGGFS